MRSHIHVQCADQCILQIAETLFPTVTLATDLLVVQVCTVPSIFPDNTSIRG